jgi:pimeloyl-ACP methyl ester carboxylesterase
MNAPSLSRSTARIVLFTVAEGRPDSQACLAEHGKEHEALARLSRNGQLIIATHGGHHVQIDEPQLVSTAIRTVVVAARKSHSIR